MDPFASYESTPWHLIAASLQGDLTVEEQTALDQWLAFSQTNRDRYEECRRLWEEGLADMEFFTREDARADWEDLRIAMHGAEGAVPARVAGGKVKKK